jgi:hypothetical protein
MIGLSPEQLRQNLASVLPGREYHEGATFYLRKWYKYDYRYFHFCV